MRVLVLLSEREKMCAKRVSIYANGPVDVGVGERGLRRLRELTIM